MDNHKARDCSDTGGYSDSTMQIYSLITRLTQAECLYREKKFSSSFIRPISYE